MGCEGAKERKSSTEEAEGQEGHGEITKDNALRFLWILNVCTCVPFLLLAIMKILPKGETNSIESKFLVVLFFLSFALGPYIVNSIYSLFVKKISSGIVLLVLNFLYIFWASYIYHDAMVVHVDPQSAIALLFIGIYAFPVLLVFWILIFIWERIVISRNGSAL